MTPVQKLVTSAALGAALAASPAKADPPKPMEASKAADPGDVKAQLDTVRDEVKKLQTFRKDMEDIVLGRADGKSSGDPALLKRMSDLEASLKRIEDRLARMDGKPADAPRSTSGFAAPALSAPTAGKTAVRLVNDYPVEMSMMVNGKSYRLTAGEVRAIDVPPGSYTYELLHAGSQPTTSTIKDGETVTLRIR